MRTTLLLLVMTSVLASAQTPAPARRSVQWEELTAADFRDGIAESRGTCLLPFGILEKHGPHLPLGNDLINARAASLAAAQQEYAIVFAPYYFGQIFEARQQPGTIAYSADLQMKLLQETTDEMARNGCKRIVVVNGHGGNTSFLQYFAQTQLARPHDYVVYVYDGGYRAAGGPPHKTPTATDLHAGESETSLTLATRPDLVHMDRAGSQSGADQARLKLPPGLYTGIWWYARFPNHYAGDATAATRELGEFDLKAWVSGVVAVIKAVKADDTSLKLQNEFYQKAQHPLETQQ